MRQTNQHALAKPWRQGRRSPRRRSAPWGSLREAVYAILRKVPRGKVVTYGQLALLAGDPRGARQVGWIAHAGGRNLPWQRVVNRFGGLASGYTGGRAAHKADLEADGVRVRADFSVDLGRCQWQPPSHWSPQIGRPHAIAPERSGIQVHPKARSLGEGDHARFG